MMERFNHAKKVNERFKVVQKGVFSDDGRSIPNAPETNLTTGLPNPNIRV